MLIHSQKLQRSGGVRHSGQNSLGSLICAAHCKMDIAQAESIQGRAGRLPRDLGTMSSLSSIPPPQGNGDGSLPMGQVGTLQRASNA